MSFCEAAQSTSTIGEDACKPGLQALQPRDKRKISVGNPRRLTGSVNLDAELRAAYPDANRWDYGIGINDHAVWGEIHPASTSEVKTVIEKLKWLKNWIKDSDFEQITPQNGYYWLATGGVHITKNSPQLRNLSKHGLSVPRKWLDLDRIA